MRSCLLIHQVEANLLMPLVMGKGLKLHPVTILFFALAMVALCGPIGALVAVPTVVVLQIVIEEFYLTETPAERSAMASETNRLLSMESIA